MANLRFTLSGDASKLISTIAKRDSINDEEVIRRALSALNVLEEKRRRDIKIGEPKSKFKLAVIDDSDRDAPQVAVRISGI
ncbi:MAG: hypothetical protein HQL56_18690 [Magnetococcales bacterium]|nr:hypothetical protein [Magnetococcales bacterium]